MFSLPSNPFSGHRHHGLSGHSYPRLGRGHFSNHATDGVPFGPHQWPLHSSHRRLHVEYRWRSDVGLLRSPLRPIVDTGRWDFILIWVESIFVDQVKYLEWLLTRIQNTYILKFYFKKRRKKSYTWYFDFHIFPSYKILHLLLQIQP